MENDILIIEEININALLKIVRKTLQRILVHYDITNLQLIENNMFQTHLRDRLKYNLRTNNNIHILRKFAKIINSKCFIDGIIQYTNNFNNNIISFDIPNPKNKTTFIRISFINCVYFKFKYNINIYYSIQISYVDEIIYKNNHSYHDKYYKIEVEQYEYGDYGLDYDSLPNKELIEIIDSNDRYWGGLLNYNINKECLNGMITIYNFYCWYSKYIHNKKYIIKPTKEINHKFSFYTVLKNNKLYFPPVNERISTTKITLPALKGTKMLLINKIIEANNSEKIIKIIHVLFCYFNKNNNYHLHIINKII